MEGYSTNVPHCSRTYVSKIGTGLRKSLAFRNMEREEEKGVKEEEGEEGELEDMFVRFLAT